MRSRHASVYAVLLRLYPADLRAAHGAEMIQVLDDLVRERGRTAWARVLLDLAVSLPRTRLESLMHRTPGSSAVSVTILTIGALASVAALLMFGPWGLPVPLAAIALLLSQRSSLARAMGPHGKGRPGRLAAVGAAVSAVVFLGTLGAWLAGIDRGYGFEDGVLLLFNVLGFGSLMGMVAFGATVLVRRRTRRSRPVV